MDLCVLEWIFVMHFPLLPFILDFEILHSHLFLVTTQYYNTNNMLPEIAARCFAFERYHVMKLYLCKKKLNNRPCGQGIAWRKTSVLSLLITQP